MMGMNRKAGIGEHLAKALLAMPGKPGILTSKVSKLPESTPQQIARRFSPDLDVVDIDEGKIKRRQRVGRADDGTTNTRETARQMPIVEMHDDSVRAPLGQSGEKLGVGRTVAKVPVAGFSRKTEHSGKHAPTVAQILAQEDGNTLARGILSQNKTSLAQLRTATSAFFVQDRHSICEPHEKTPRNHPPTRYTPVGSGQPRS